MSNLKLLSRNIIDRGRQHSPAILTGVSVTGTITTAVLAHDAALKAKAIIDDEEEVIGRKLTKKEKFKKTWKCYIPAGSVGLITILSTISSNTIHEKRTAALAGLYSLTDKAFTEYKNKVVEQMGADKLTKLKDSIAADNVKDANLDTHQNIIVTGNGECLCFDKVIGRPFKSDINKIKQAVNEINYRLRNEHFISLNDFFYELGLDYVKLGNDTGFHIDSGGLEVSYSSQLTENGQPCLVIDYEVVPQYRGSHR